MRVITAKVLSVHAGRNDDKSKPDLPSIRVELDGIVGDKHRSFSRTTWAGDKQPKGTVRRNERQWSAVSHAELREISKALDLREPILPSTLGANLCLQGIPGALPTAEGHAPQIPLRRGAVCRRVQPTLS